MARPLFLQGLIACSISARIGGAYTASNNACSEKEVWPRETNSVVSFIYYPIVLNSLAWPDIFLSLGVIIYGRTVQGKLRKLLMILGGHASHVSITCCKAMEDSNAGH